VLQPKARQAPKQGAERDAPLKSGQGRAEAEVAAQAEAQVLVWRAREVEGILDAFQLFRGNGGGIEGWFAARPIV
jgi:hypothetical protein